MKFAVGRKPYKIIFENYYSNLRYLDPNRCVGSEIYGCSHTRFNINHCISFVQTYFVYYRVLVCTSTG